MQDLLFCTNICSGISTRTLLRPAIQYGRLILSNAFYLIYGTKVCSFRKFRLMCITGYKKSIALVSQPITFRGNRFWNFGTKQLKLRTSLLAHSPNFCDVPNSIHCVLAISDKIVHALRELNKHMYVIH